MLWYNFFCRSEFSGFLVIPLGGLNGAKHAARMLSQQPCLGPQTRTPSEADKIPESLSDEGRAQRSPLHPFAVGSGHDFHASKEGGGGAQSPQSTELCVAPEGKARQGGQKADMLLLISVAEGRLSYHPRVGH